MKASRLVCQIENVKLRIVGVAERRFTKGGKQARAASARTFLLQDHSVCRPLKLSQIILVN